VKGLKAAWQGRQLSLQQLLRTAATYVHYCTPNAKNCAAGDIACLLRRRFC
jgi:hypothetical protein